MKLSLTKPFAIRKTCLCAMQAIVSLVGLYSLFILRPFLAMGDTQNRGRDENSLFPPLILVHPAIQNCAVWYFYAKAFRKAGFRAIYYFEYACREPSFNAVTERLAHLVEKVSKLHPEKGAILVGASLGGLLIRNSLYFMENPERIGGLITLATPHKGSSLARMVPKWFLPLLHSIFYESPVIGELEAREEAAGIDIPKTAFYSEMDEKVKPVTALYPPAGQGWNEVKTVSLSHMAIMLHPPTIRAVIREIGKFQERGGRNTPAL
ncbi:alpha/beta hydrolase [Desulfococcaceae bacterium OttesenSCG-928-F15]|nr:alpha/beta hydrolase [Desulfococcaceae bacterium OttesenSCG-928-F15]